MFFSDKFALRSGGVLPRTGFSLVELLVSVLLITAIAVLSVPTFRDFAPHARYPDEVAGATPASESAATKIMGRDATLEERAFTARPESGDATRNVAAPAPDASKRSLQGGKSQ